MKKPSKAKTLKKPSRRGGLRPGAGRKPKPRNPDAAPKSKARPHSPARMSPKALAAQEQVERARRHAILAIETWADVAKNGQSENAAAEMIMKWGYGTPLGIGEATFRPAAINAEKPAKEVPLGKKEALVEAARNPDTSTPMGAMMAERAALATKKLDS